MAKSEAQAGESLLDDSIKERAERFQRQQVERVEEMFAEKDARIAELEVERDNFKERALVCLVLQEVAEADRDAVTPSMARRGGMMTDAASMKRYTSMAPVVMEDFPDAHHVFLQVTNQRFCVSPHGCDTKDDAEWMQEQLCVALAKIVDDELVGYRTPATPPDFENILDAAGKPFEASTEEG